MAKVKVVNNNLDQNLNGSYFDSTASEIIFSFGSFNITSNFSGRKHIDYTNTLSSFVRAVTLDTMGVTDIQSEVIHQYSTSVVLNLDKSDLNTFIRYGSAYEFLRICVEDIISNYPCSLFMSSQVSRNNNVTYFDYFYDIVTNTSTFSIPINCIVNTFGMVYNYGNLSAPDEKDLKNLNLSYDKYIIWTPLNPTGNTCSVIGYTGNTSGRQYLTIKANGNPFQMISGYTSSPVDFHIKPNSFIFEEFRALLNQYEKYIVSTRIGTDGFQFTIKDPTLLDDGNIIYSDTKLLWATSDKYNIDIKTPIYQKFLEIILTIGAKYDKVKTDLIARFLTPASIKSYDLTEEGKMTKLLRIYGREFDQIREFIDSLVYINKVTYDKINNIPDQLVKNLSRTFGWDYFSLVNEKELVSGFLTVDDDERNLHLDLLPAEIDVELWRRILMNTNYFWKSKGTRESIKSMFLLIGIPEAFINITEYVYTVDGKINPNTVPLSITDFPSNSLPYDNNGYPVAPLEINDFYFQMSGNTDSGQAYLNVFRMAGFDLSLTVDNKKSWVQSGATYRIDEGTPQYFQEDSRLVINTKEVDVSLDTAQGIEYDIYNTIQTDFIANSKYYTLPYSYVNISLGVSGFQTTFPLPSSYSSNKVMGDLEVRFNGVLLNAPKTGLTTGITYQADYIIDEITKTFTLVGGTAANNSTHRDVIQATFIYSGTTNPISGITVQYVVTRVNANPNGAIIVLPSYPRGDVQVTVNGVALTKGTPQFVADYIVDQNNSTGYSQIIIQNPELITYLQINSEIQIAYVYVTGSNDISARSEVLRIDSFNGSKLYYNSSANKYVYKLNYKANNASDIKVLVNGIGLEPNMDYSINTLNPYEVFLPKGLKYGDIISVYYLVGTGEYFKPIINEAFDLGDVSLLSFAEFIQLIQTRLINVRNRKTISDFKGGWYPSLLKIYFDYLRKGKISNNSPLSSNEYTFQGLYTFLGKYNAFFQRFVDQLLSATIIIRKSGLMVRNTLYSNQKFMYRRGINLYSGNSTTIDHRGNPIVKYLGDDSAIFQITQFAPKLTPVPVLYVRTIPGTLGSIITGGDQIQGYNKVTEYGIYYRKLYSSDLWSKSSTLGSLTVDHFSKTITDLVANTTYEYKAYIKSGIYGYTGLTKTIITPVATPKIYTKIGSAGITSINITGGIGIIEYANTDYYGMQYKESIHSTWITTSLVSGALSVNNYNFTIQSLSPSTAYDYRAYMVIGGVPYVGDIQHITTAALPVGIPIVNTGSAEDFTSNTMYIRHNNIEDKSNGIINEYGVLYTQNPIYGTSNNLVYGSVNVCKKSNFDDICIDDTFFCGVDGAMTGLLPNTQTYYRGFAKNSAGSGYGVVKTQQTCLPPTTPLTLSMVREHSSDIGSANGCLCISPSIPAGQCVTLRVDINQGICGSGIACSELFCKPNGGSYHSLQILSSCAAGIYAQPTTFTLNYGDTICFNHCNSGNAGSFSSVYLYSINSYSSGIIPSFGNRVDRLDL